MSRPPSASVSEKLSSLRPRRCASLQIHRCSGLSTRSKMVGPPTSFTLAQPRWYAARVLRWTLRMALVFLAAAIFFAAGRMDAAWWARRVVVPACYLPPARWILPAVRAALFAAGLALCVVSLRIRPPSAAAAGRVALAVVAALCASEMALRFAERDEKGRHHPRLEFLLGAPDARTGWSFVPRRTLRFGAPGGGPVVDYAVDSQGDRAASTDFVEDPAAPTLLVTGESIAVGHGLEWKDTFAAQAGARLGLQIVHVAEGGYGSGQALLRARDPPQPLPPPAPLGSP